MRPVLLDLFCCQGGAAMGYHRAGFEVIGIDVDPQPRYPFEFHRMDWRDALRQFGTRADAIHASPPCQRYSSMTNCRPGLADTYPDLVGPVRDALLELGRPFVIENVPGAPLRPDVVLCGCQFGLEGRRGHGVRRVRWFETHPQMFELRAPCYHPTGALPVTGHSPGKEWRERFPGEEAPGIDERRDAMGVPWMDRDGATEAIPPAYTEYLGGWLLEAVSVTPCACT